MLCLILPLNGHCLLVTVYFIYKIINAADFKITLEDERKVIDDLAAEIRTLAEGIRQEVDTVAQKGDADRQSIKEKIDEEIKKVCNINWSMKVINTCYTV